jgi:lipid intermediate transporter
MFFLAVQDSSIGQLVTLARLSHVPLTLLYSSLTKLFLLLLLALWKPSKIPSTRAFAQVNGTDTGLYQELMSHEYTRRALEMLDDDKLDREWIVRNVLGGLSAGFGLRGEHAVLLMQGPRGTYRTFAVVLDMPPAFTTLIILIGYVPQDCDID